MGISPFNYLATIYIENKQSHFDAKKSKKSGKVD